MHCDVTSETDGLAAVQKAQALGQLAALINCAGVAPAEKVAGKNGAHRLESFARTININLIGTFNMIRLAAEAMTHNEPQADTGERGVIISTTSIAAFDGQMGQAAYSASKGSIVSMTDGHLTRMQETAAHFGFPLPNFPNYEIGRASCRERV